MDALIYPDPVSPEERTKIKLLRFINHVQSLVEDIKRATQTGKPINGELITALESIILPEINEDDLITQVGQLIVDIARLRAILEIYQYWESVRDSITIIGDSIRQLVGDIDFEIYQSLVNVYLQYYVQWELQCYAIRDNDASVRSVAHEVFSFLQTRRHNVEKTVLVLKDLAKSEANWLKMCIKITIDKWTE